jgi:hypothetical protein
MTIHSLPAAEAKNYGSHISTPPYAYLFLKCASYLRTNNSVTSKEISHIIGYLYALYPGRPQTKEREAMKERKREKKKEFVMSDTCNNAFYAVLCICTVND